MSDWRFDPVSAVIGAVLGLFLAWLGSLLRAPFERLIERLKERVNALLGELTASAEERYRERAIKWANGAHVLSSVAPLDQIFVAPPLMAPPPPPSPQADAPSGRAPISLKELLRGYSRLVLLGDLASGRTTLLAYLTLVFARREAMETVGVLTERLPIYLPLPRLDWEAVEEQTDAEEGEESEEKQEIDRLKLLIECALEAVDAQSAYAPALRQRLEDGTAVILADRWDELEPDRREQAAEWLSQLADELPNNIWLIAGGSEGFASLADEGFAPVRINPWKQVRARDLLTRWEEALEPEEEEEFLPDPAPLMENLSMAVRRGDTPLELNLRCWLYLAGGDLPRRRTDLFLEVLDRLMEPSEEETWTPAPVRAALSDLALTLQQEGRDWFTHQELVQALEGVLPPEGERPARVKEQILQGLKEAEVLRKSRDAAEHAFAHPLWRVCLAARQMALLPPDSLVEHLEDPRWFPMTDFYAELGSMEPVVEAWLDQPDDLWLTRLRRTARWIALAPPDAQWRNGVMAVLARTFLTASLPLPVRRRLTKALIQTADPGVSYLFQQAAEHEQTDVRIAVLQAMGQLKGEVNLVLLNSALRDSDPDVQAAAVRALRAAQSPAAAELLARLLVEGEQELRVKAARALAHFGEPGWEVLQEALESEDLLTRRAAVYGLAEVDQPWTRERLIEVAREDSEWIVRSAADGVLEEESGPRLIEEPFDPAEASWLISWAAERGEPVPRGEAAFSMVVRALREGEPGVRKAAVWTLGLAGGPEHMHVLQEAMEDEEPNVASAALDALEELCRRHGIAPQEGSKSGDQDV